MPSAPASAARERTADSPAHEPEGELVLEARPTPSSGATNATAALGLELGALSDVGPAGPATATSQGIVLVTKTGELALAERRGKAGGLVPLELDRSAFAPVARGPSVAGGFAYFVLGEKLVRRSLSGGALETLANDVQQGSRTSALELAPGKVAVAYIGRANAEGTSRARLYFGGRSADITPEGAGASSVSLTPSEGGALAVTIDGRTGMTPVHARPLELGAQGATLGSDTVVWVAASAGALTEIAAAGTRDRPFAFLPIEKDATHFGLAELELVGQGRGDARVGWRVFENGLDLSPVAAALLCGELYVAFVRPATSAPGAPAELVLARAARPEAAVLANARGFASVSLAHFEKGGLLSYVADRRTWGRELACRR